MGMFDEFSRSLSMAGNDMMSRTRESADGYRLQSQYRQNEQAICSLYEQIGRRYLELERKDEDARISDLIEQLTAIQAQNESIASQLRTLAHMRLCPECHAEIDEASIFCPVCGKQLQASDPLIENGRLCMHCGGFSPMESRFCIHCGSLLPSLSEQEFSKAKAAGSYQQSQAGKPETENLETSEEESILSAPKTL